MNHHPLSHLQAAGLSDVGCKRASNEDNFCIDKALGLLLVADGMGGHAAGEIASRFEISRPAVSRHLRVLRECGLLRDEVQGRERLYRLDVTALAPLEAWLARLHDRWAGALDALETEVYRTRRERRTAPSIRKEKSA
jgi:DNA-binding transcriptional ArsR family regulator